jgi:TetR/AcrR family fatty acid metabolism transcriptional regulator
MAVVYQAETHQINRLAEEQIKEMSKLYLDIVSEIVEQGQEEGVIRKDLYLGLVKRFILGAVDEVINTWIHSGGKYDLVSMADPLVDLFLKGIGNLEETDNIFSAAGS